MSGVGTRSVFGREAKVEPTGKYLRRLLDPYPIIATGQRLNLLLAEPRKFKIKAGSWLGNRCFKAEESPGSIGQNAR